MVDLDRHLESIRRRLGDAIHQARLRTNRDQESVQDAVGVSRGMMSRIETASGSMPSRELAVRIAREVGADDAWPAEIAPVLDEIG